MRWQRGLFRLWLVLSVCWVVPVGAFYVGAIVEEPAPCWAMHDPAACGLLEQGLRISDSRIDSHRP